MFSLYPSSINNTNSTFKLTNKITKMNKASKDIANNCQNSFIYFEQSKKPSVQWGSDKPMKESCPVNYKPHMGKPTHSLWNNMTRRKSLIIKE